MPNKNRTRPPELLSKDTGFDIPRLHGEPQVLRPAPDRQALEASILENPPDSVHKTHKVQTVLTI